jgi:hypothetical protein
MTYEGYTLVLTPFAAQALSDQERNDIARRLVALKVRANVGKAVREGRWVIRVSSWEQRDGQPVYYCEDRVYSGLHLADCMAKSLAAAERAMAAWTPEEILQVAAQSGLTVERA